MKTPAIFPRLADMANAIERIHKMTASIDFKTYEAQWETQWATERALEIISEASRHIPDEVKENYPEIAWRQIAGIGNILRHEYHRIEPKIIWDIIQTHLRELEKAIADLMRNCDSSL